MACLLRLALTPGEARDNRLARKLLSHLRSGEMLVADRGYDADWTRELAMKKGARAYILTQTQSHQSGLHQPYLYRARNRVERFFNRIKKCRRTKRHDKIAANYRAFVRLSSVWLWLAARNESTP